MILEELDAPTTNQNTIVGFQPHTQSTSVTLNPKTNKTETTKNKSPFEVTGVSVPTCSALILQYQVLQYHCNLPQKH